MREFVQKRQPKTRPVDLNHVVQRSLQLLQFDLDRHTIAADVDLAPDLPPVMADEIQIEQVLVNLICNAVEAVAENPAGPRKISLQTERQQDSNQVWATVIDSGAGMSGENVRQLFDPFFTTKPNGLGMGLNISRSIIESHGGRLTASANPGGGMRFRFTLPMETGVAACPTN
jgi:C4-dicarboxylate-specific signal transduction histidine kinase